MQSILVSGLLKQKSHGTLSRLRKYFITCLEERHLPQVMQLQQVIIDHLDSPDLLQAFSHEFMKYHMGSKGVVLGVFVGSRLVAFRNLYYPDPWDKQWNLGADIGLGERELARVANLQMVCVHPQFRGNSLAFKMNTIALELLRGIGTHHHVCATVSPYNVWNIPVLLASGFCIAGLKNKYGGKLRYIVHQNLRKPFVYDDDNCVRVSLNNLEIQKKLLNQGFFGTDLSRREKIHANDPILGCDLIFKTPIHGGRIPIHRCEPFIPDLLEGKRYGGAIDITTPKAVQYKTRRRNSIAA